MIIMKVSITYTKLKGPFKFFALSSQALHIIRQLRATNCKDFKKKGIWTTHYTMTLWENAEEMKSFAASGAHLAAMQKSKEIAQEIGTIIIDAERLPSWKEAQSHLSKAKIINFD